jgi:hypothetical protein
MINGSRILVISVKTFNYEQFIVQKLEELGAHVTFFDERPRNTVLVKGLIRIKKDLYSRQIENYYNKILNEVKDFEFDYLFVIKGEVIPIFFLLNFKESHPNTTLIYYTWDSFKNNPHSFENLFIFDKKYTFDPNDASDFGLNFRPLFYIDNYNTLKNEKNYNLLYDVLFIGTAHSDRYSVSQNVSNWCRNNGMIAFNYYYISSYFVYLYKVIFDKSFKNFKFKDLSFRSLSINDLIDLYSKSKIILDINHTAQSGLTMRTIEALGSNKKIITTNSNIIKYHFYNPQNVLVIERNQSIFPLDFFSTPFSRYQQSFYDYMSIEGWLNSIFNSDNEEKYQVLL